jgi:hypothetical protein
MLLGINKNVAIIVPAKREDFFHYVPLIEHSLRAPIASTSSSTLSSSSSLRQVYDGLSDKVLEDHITKSER